MSVIDDKVNALRTFSDNINRYTKTLVLDNERVIIELNVDKQLFEDGINRDGISIDSYQPYHPITVRYKFRKRQPYDRVTLRDSGDFHKSFKVIADDLEFMIYADDWKLSELLNKYGANILGLTDENLQIVVWEYIYPAILSKLRQMI